MTIDFSRSISVQVACFLKKTLQGLHQIFIENPPKWSLSGPSNISFVNFFGLIFACYSTIGHYVSCSISLTIGQSIVGSSVCLSSVGNFISRSIPSQLFVSSAPKHRTNIVYMALFFILFFFHLLLFQLFFFSLSLSLSIDLIESLQCLF